ncbi:MAG: DUF3892 domain-containing protein [Spirochaetaceae bacterium]|nr:DUF3892 domain-containing protein [Spirochaetaceae bacterium]
MAKSRLIVTKEEDTGMNAQFKDTGTGETLTRTEVARRIDQGQYSNYHHYRDDNNRLVIRSNPDGKKSNNLG